jgi:hypothetical protein
MAADGGRLRNEHEFGRQVCLQRLAGGFGAALEARMDLGGRLRIGTLGMLALGRRRKSWSCLRLSPLPDDRLTTREAR